MKIKEGGVMDIQKEREAFEALQNQKIFKWFEFDSSVNGYVLKDISATLEKLTALAELNYGWDIWQAAKAQAVPEWKDYTVESPRIDGPYQIFIMNQQLVAKWESPWGFSSIEDGDALNQELITHWSVLGNDPAIEPREPAND